MRLQALLFMALAVLQGYSSTTSTLSVFLICYGTIGKAVSIFFFEEIAHVFDSSPDGADLQVRYEYGHELVLFLFLAVYIIAGEALFCMLYKKVVDRDQRREGVPFYENKTVWDTIIFLAALTIVGVIATILNYRWLPTYFSLI